MEDAGGVLSLLSLKYIFFADTILLTVWTADHVVVDSTDRTDITLIPTINPDGFDRSTEGQCTGACHFAKLQDRVPSKNPCSDLFIKTVTFIFVLKLFRLVLLRR